MKHFSVEFHRPLKKLSHWPEDSFSSRKAAKKRIGRGLEAFIHRTKAALTPSWLRAIKQSLEPSTPLLAVRTFLTFQFPLKFLGILREDVCFRGIFRGIERINVKPRTRFAISTFAALIFPQPLHTILSEEPHCDRTSLPIHINLENELSRIEDKMVIPPTGHNARLGEASPQVM